MKPSRDLSPRVMLRRKVLLGMLLVERGLLSHAQLSQVLEQQAKTGEYLGAMLLRQGVITEAQLMEALAEQLGLPHVELATATIEPAALAKVPAALASHYRLIPLSVTPTGVRLAVADPLDVQMLDELKLLLGCDIQPVLATARQIQDAIQRHYGLGAPAVAQLLQGNGHSAPELVTVEDVGTRTEEASVLSFVNQLLRQAVNDRATDVHLEPYEPFMRIRERVDGVLYEIPTPPDLVKLHQLVVSRIKIMARLDVIERRLPQDGRIKVRLDGQEHDLRVSILPTAFGESVDIRLLSARMLYSLEHLGLAEDHHRLLNELIARPHGIIFVTGPTGSGKTTTLYSCLSQLNTPAHKILTIEDPVEYQLPGITQIQVHPKIGLTFAQGLRSMLRHDPDIMMVGEVRDPETAEITIRSALTGHLVFSTLHTNHAAGGVARLLDMGVEPYLVTSSVLCFIAQRLVRLLCEACKEPMTPSAGLREHFGPDLPSALMKPKGCAACNQTGYKGRTAVYEFLVINEAIQRLILRRASASEILQAAREADAKSAGAMRMRTMRQDGWLKICRGLTTPDEVLRVTD